MKRFRRLLYLAGTLLKGSFIGIKGLADIGDVHVYGGLILIGIAVPYGWGVVGAALVYIGLRHFK